MPVWLVTGGTGFLGRHVLAALEAYKPAGIEVVVAGRRHPRDHGSRRFVATDLDDPLSLAQTLAAIRPAVVFHLAGQTPPAAPAEYYRGNTLATIHLLDALRAQRQAVRVVLAGSAAELGPIAAEELPVAEDHPCRPADSYGLSKWLATTAGLAARPPLEVVVARIFNPIGPGLPRTQAFGRFAAELAAPERDPHPLVVGDLDTRRDFVDVRDVARALVALAERGEPAAVYHVGTGQSHGIREGLEYLIGLCGREVAVEVRADLAASRNGGPSDSRADIGRIVAATGWTPEVAWHQSLDDLWEATLNWGAACEPFPDPGCLSRSQRRGPGGKEQP
jgi:GDP-4-dehydro-6-deoxy-D-mannose reductase